MSRSVSQSNPGKKDDSNLFNPLEYVTENLSEEEVLKVK